MIERMPRPDWQPLPRAGTAGVSARVLLNRDGIVVAQLRFAAHATIDEHSAAIEIDVLCLAGEGFVSMDGKTSSFRVGERVVWPAGVTHRLWTEDSEMETLMVERHAR
jgi:quercetin dioxygenase-like cupin family protein